MRHGETALNAENKFRGWLNVPLSDKGRQEAQEAGRFLSKYPIQTVIHSPLDRTKESSAIAVPHATRVISDSRLMPLNVGALSGKDKDVYKSALAHFIKHRDRPLPMGESVSQFEQRFKPALEQGIASGRAGKLALFVAHTSNMVAADAILGNKHAQPEATDIVEPGGIAGVFADGNKFELRPLYKPAKAAAGIAS